MENHDSKTLEKFVVTMYERSCTVAGVNAARPDMFARKQKPCETIPPTQAALLQHAKRAAYQAGMHLESVDSEEARNPQSGCQEMDKAQ